MLKIYEDELKELKNKMEKAEKFSNKIPIFKDEIIKNKYTGEEQHISFDKRYKDIYLAGGINRNHYKSKSNCTVTNYIGEYDKYLFNIYINSLNLFGDGIYEDFDLEKIQYECKVFFYDALNKEYYVEDENIEEFLEKLNEWYISAKSKVDNYKKEQRIKELEEQLEKLKGKSE